MQFSSIARVAACCSATTWEWKEDIDEQRAQEAKKRAEEMIAKGGLSDHDYKIVEAKLQRALVRLSVKS